MTRLEDNKMKNEYYIMERYGLIDYLLRALR